MARKYLIETFGCQMNYHDSERMAGLLEAITGEHERDVMGSPFEFILDQPSRIEFRRAVDRLLREPPGEGRATHLQLRTRAALTGRFCTSMACGMPTAKTCTPVSGSTLPGPGGGGRPRFSVLTSCPSMYV